MQTLEPGDQGVSSDGGIFGYLETFIEYPTWGLVFIVAVAVGLLLGITFGRAAAFIVFLIAAGATLAWFAITFMFWPGETAGNVSRYALFPLAISYIISRVLSTAKYGY